MAEQGLQARRNLGSETGRRRGRHAIHREQLQLSHAAQGASLDRIVMQGKAK
jgi:hypothetical protein